MKKLLSVLLVVLLGATLTGCKGEKAEVAETVETVIKDVEVEELVFEEEYIEEEYIEDEYYEDEEICYYTEEEFEIAIRSTAIAFKVYKEELMENGLSEECIMALSELMMAQEYDPSFEDGYDSESFQLEIVNLLIDDGIIYEECRGLTCEQVEAVYDEIGLDCPLDTTFDFE